jgi:hypothetical protein
LAEPPPQSWSIFFDCPACQQRSETWLSVPVYMLLTGPSLVCSHCDAIVAVTLSVAFPAPPKEG